MSEESNVTPLGGDTIRGVFIRANLLGLVERAQGYDERATAEAVVSGIAKSIRIAGYTIIEQDAETGTVEGFRIVDNSEPTIPPGVLDDVRNMLEAMGATIETVEEQWRRQDRRMVLEQAQINIADAIISDALPQEVIESIGQVLVEAGYL